MGDLFAPALKWKQKLPAVVEPKRPTRVRRTPQPARAVPERSRQGGRRRFVIQQHAAKQLHYDFRLEMHDVLKSWAIPKGLPYALGERRLAMETEDHPVAYLDFEGTIPAGQYGGGTVLVWDIGTYDLVEGNYYKGSVKVHLDGKKLKGEWTIGKDRSKGENAWTIAKSGDAAQPVTDHTSALSGRTLQQIARDQDRVWRGNRGLPSVADLPAAKVEFVEPMKAQLVDELPGGAGWQYEIKLDGYRALALRGAGGVRLLSRNNNSLGERFPSIATACEALPDNSIFDGEVVALDENGRPSFSLLQHWGTVRHPLLYYVFDLLVLRGKNVQKLPLTDRRALLSEAMNAAADPLRLLGTVDAPTAELIEAARQNGIEGFVAKRTNSLYEPGLRSGAWVKYKVNQSHELVIGGYIPGGKHGFESLLVGYYEGRDLMFIGKVRNGFVPETREAVFRRFERLETERCPFANLPEPRNARRGEALTAEAMKRCRWLKPKLVAQIEYTDWTDANHLRHSRFAGLREDKDAREVVRERS